jgi:hypothetical protein
MAAEVLKNGSPFVKLSFSLRPPKSLLSIASEGTKVATAGLRGKCNKASKLTSPEGEAVNIHFSGTPKAA